MAAMETSMPDGRYRGVENAEKGKGGQTRFFEVSLPPVSEAAYQKSVPLMKERRF
jgi:hypothetical protein